MDDIMDNKMYDKSWIHYIGNIVKRNYYPSTDFSNVWISCEGYKDISDELLYSLSDDLQEKLSSHNLFHVDYQDLTAKFTHGEDDNIYCFTDGKNECHEPHTWIPLIYNKKHDNENLLSHLFREHKIKDSSIVEEIQLYSLKTPKINLEHLKNCTNLSVLEIYDIDLIDIELIPTKNIRTLSFQSSRPLDSYIKHIHEMKKLTYLSLSFVNDSSLIDLTPITTTNQKIEYLGISTNYKKINIKNLYKLKNLWMVVLNRILDIDFHSLYKLEKLEKLVIYTNEEIDDNKLLPLFDKDVDITLNNKYLEY